MASDGATPTESTHAATQLPLVHGNVRGAGTTNECYRIDNLKYEREEKRMLTEPTTEKLKAMRLGGNDDRLARPSRRKPQVGEPFLDERLALLIDAEWLHRENARVGRALREAKLKMAKRASRISTIRQSASSTRRSCASFASCRW